MINIVNHNVAEAEGEAEMRGVNTLCVSCSTDFNFLLNIFSVIAHIYHLRSAVHKSLNM